VGAAQSTRVRGNDVRIDGFLGYVDLRYRFYGTGTSAGETGASVPILQKGFVFAPELLFQVAKRTFVGLRYRGLREETAVEGDPGELPSAGRSGPSQFHHRCQLGNRPSGYFDTRDHDMSPSRACWWTCAPLRCRTLGSDLDYQTGATATRRWSRRGPSTALRPLAAETPRQPERRYRSRA
jgi:hypothetical protein